MDALREYLTVGIGRLALVISKWIVPVVGILVVYKIYDFFFNINWNKELQKGIRLGDVAKVQAALKKGASADTKDDDECPMIVTATKMNKSAIVSLLLSAGCKVDARDSTGKTALIHACKKGYMDIVQILLAKKADPNLKCFEGTTPLIVSACKILFFWR